MITGIGVYGLSVIAGTLSTLSPCTLPLLPILVGTALTAHRYGPIALATGLAFSYTITGIFLATVGLSMGFDQVVFRNITAGLLLLFGLILLLEQLQGYFSMVAARLSGSGQSLLNQVSSDSLTGQFILGTLLGVVWSPCVGPTLGATIVLASQGKDLLHVAAVMALFGIGATIPLITLGLMSHQAVQNFKGKLSVTGKAGKKLLGALLLLLGVIVISGIDKTFEAWILTHAPAWLNNLTISI